MVIGQCYADLVTIGGSCVEKCKTRLSDGVLILHTDLCRGCDEYFVNDGGTCSNKHLTWTCEGESIFLEIAFKGSFNVGRFLFNNRCEKEVWRCDGTTKNPMQRKMFLR